MTFFMLAIAGLQLVAGSPADTGASHPPVLINPQKVISSNDYPDGAMRNDEFGVVSLLVEVSNEGKATACDVTETSGYTELDHQACSLFVKRAQFDPGRDETGAPVEARFRVAITWGVGKNIPTIKFDMQLQVSRIPPDYKSPVKTRVIFGAMGHADSCEIVNTSGSEAADRAACAYLQHQLTVTPPKSLSKDVPATAVRYVTASLALIN